MNKETMKKDYKTALGNILWLTGVVAAVCTILL